MNDLQVIGSYNFLEKVINIYGSVNNPLFLAKDVAEWIEHTAVHMMIKTVDEEEKVRKNVSTLGGNQESWFLTEDGLYEVFMQSRKPIAKEFKKKIKAILKEIRLTGVYSVNQSLHPEIELLKAKTDYINALNNIIINSNGDISSVARLLGDSNINTTPKLKTLKNEDFRGTNIDPYKTIDQFLKVDKITVGEDTRDVYDRYVKYCYNIGELPRTRSAFVSRMRTTTRLCTICVSRGRTTVSIIDERQPLLKRR